MQCIGQTIIRLVQQISNLFCLKKLFKTALTSYQKHSFKLKMHHKPFGGRAQPGPAGGAYSAPKEKGVIWGKESDGVWGNGEWKGGRRRVVMKRTVGEMW